MSDGQECKAPDCDEPVEWPREHCSTVCFNVRIEVAAETLQAAREHGTIPKMEDLSDDRVAAIRRKNERAHRKINRRIQEQFDEVSRR